MTHLDSCNVYAVLTTGSASGMRSFCRDPAAGPDGLGSTQAEGSNL